MRIEMERYDAARDLLHLHLDSVRRLLQTLLLDVLLLDLLLQLLVPLLLGHHGRAILLLLRPSHQFVLSHRLELVATTLRRLDITLDGPYLLGKRLLNMETSSQCYLLVFEHAQSVQHLVGEHDEVDRRTQLLSEARSGWLKQIREGKVVHSTHIHVLVSTDKGRRKRIQWTEDCDHRKEMLISFQTILFGILLVIHGDLFVGRSRAHAHQTHKGANDFLRVWIVEVSNVERNPKLPHHVDDLILREDGKRKEPIR